MATPERGFQQPSAALWDGVHASYAAHGPSDRDSAPRRQLRKLLREYVPAGSRVIELGCGSSAWLPFLAAVHGCSVSGVDFSGEGLERTACYLDQAGVRPERLVREDLVEFVESMRMAGVTWDATASFGLLEHFDLTIPLGWHLDLLRPGGRLVATIPALTGLQGKWIDRVCPSIWSWHRALAPGAVVEALRLKGCTDIQAIPFGGLRLFGEASEAGTWQPTRWIRKIVNGFGEGLDRCGVRGIPGPWSPSCFITAVKPESAPLG